MQDFQETLQAAFESEKQKIIKDCGTGKSGKFVRTATVSFYTRLDDVIKQAMAHSGETLDCRKGCDYCCHFKVDVGAEEVFAIKHYVNQLFTAEQKQELLERTQDSGKEISTLSQTMRIQTNIACPFLSDHECMIYPVRPAMCRKVHSTDVNTCKNCFDNPSDVTISNSEQAVVSAISMTVIAAAKEGFKKAGFDSTLYDLKEILIEGLENPKCEKRWEQGKKAFPGF